MKRFTISICLTLSIISIHAQSLDSLRVVLEYDRSPSVRAEVLYKIAYQLILSSPNEADSLIQEGIQIANTADNLHLVGKYYALSGYQNKRLKDYRASFIAYTKALPAFQRSDDQFWAARCHEAIGELKIINNDFEAAQINFHEAYKLYVSTTSWEPLSNLQYKLGQVAFQKGNFTEAKTNFQLALAYYAKNGQTLKQAELYEHLATVYEKEGNLVAFETHLILAQNLLKDIEYERGLPMRASLENNFAHLKYLQEDLDGAYALFQTGFETARKTANSRLTIKLANNLAALLIEQEAPENALFYLKIAFQEAAGSGHSTEQTFRTYQLAVQAHSALGNWKQALALEEERNALEVSEERMNAAALKAQQANAVSLAQAELEVEAAQTEVQQARQRIWIIGGSILLACILIAYLFYRRMAFYRKEAWRHATNWPELQRKMDALEETLGMMG